VEEGGTTDEVVGMGARLDTNDTNCVGSHWSTVSFSLFFRGGAIYVELLTASEELTER
jgi:hypothetical protein